jgi:hypothetical protein
MVAGDLVVEREGNALIHGMVTETVRNEGGRVKVFGIVNDIVDVSPESETEVDAKAVITGQR